MKLKSLRCAICDKWYMANRNHCPWCGATQAVVIDGKMYNFNYEKLNQVPSHAVPMTRGQGASDLSLRFGCIRER
jgi:hypothetical protein